MSIAIAILCGLGWGLICALLNGLILRRSMKKNSTAAVMAGSILRTLVDVTALGLVFLLRNVLPFDYTWMLVAAAVALSTGTIVIAWRQAGKK